MKNKHSLITHIVLWVLGILIIINSISGILLYTQIKIDTKLQIDKQIKSTLNGISANINGDALEELIKGGIGQNNYYKVLNEYLNRCLEKGEFEYLYTIGKFEDNRFYYLVDSLREEDEDFSEYGLILETDEKLGYKTEESALANGSGITNIQYYPEWGYILTGYVGIYNSKGEAIALLGADFLQTDYNKRLSALTNKVWITLVVSTLIISCFLIVYLIKRLKPLREIEEAASNIAQGDLTVNIRTTRQDEIGHISMIFNRMVYELSEIMKNINHHVKNLFDHANQLVAKSKELNSASSKVSIDAIAIRDTSELVKNNMSLIMDKMEKAFEEFSSLEEKMQVAFGFVNDCWEYARQGEGAVEQASLQIINANSTVHTAREMVLDLQTKMNEADGLVETITEIARKTRVLAFNTSIEATRGSTEKEGFKVVATETSKLAQATMQAATQTKKILRIISKQSQETVVFMEKSFMQLQGGMEEGEAIVRHFKKIVETSKQIKGNMEETTGYISNYRSEIQHILSNAEEAEEDCEKLLSKGQNISAVTQEQFSSSEELLKWAVELENMSEMLQKTIALFKTF